MAWVRLSDDFYDHPRFQHVSALGVALYVAALAWCNRNATDGRISHRALCGLLSFDGICLTSGMTGRDATSDDALDELIESGLVVEDAGDYLIHDYLDYQPSRAEIEAKRDGSKQRMQKSRRLRSSVVADDVSESSSDVAPDVAAQHGAKFARSSRAPKPKPINKEELSNESSKKARNSKKKPEISIPEDWSPAESHRALAQKRHVNLSTEAEAFRAHALAHDRRCVRWDAAFTQWLLKATPGPSLADVPDRRIHEILEADAREFAAKAGEHW
jgi:hypothetical protein